MRVRDTSKCAQEDDVLSRKMAGSRPVLVTVRVKRSMWGSLEISRVPALTVHGPTVWREGKKPRGRASSASPAGR
jgi:hypothetical protein